MALSYKENQYLQSIFAYQFHSPILTKLVNQTEFQIELSRKTKKPRYLYLRNQLFGTIRASTGRIVLSLVGAQWIHLNLPPPSFRVIINPDIIPFLKPGKSLFAKFIQESDRQIRIGDEVLIVDPKDHFIASGRAKLNGKEMVAFNKGPAVKIHTIKQ